MHALRTSSLIARFVLAWFVMTLGAATASPAYHAPSMELVCTAGGGMKMVTGDDGNGVEISHRTLDCPMCLGFSASPPPARAQLPDLPQPLARALLPVVRAHIAGLVGAPLPPRGPPSLS